MVGCTFLLEVDTDAAILKRHEVYESDLKKLLREKRIRGLVRLRDAGYIEASFASAELRSEASALIRSDVSRPPPDCRY